MASSQSVIQLTPASAAFVDNRVTTLGPWVISQAIDGVLMGIVFCQLHHYFQNRKHARERAAGRFDLPLVCLVAFLAILKSIQAVTIVWEQNVMQFMNPDYARTMVSNAWFQVSAPLLTGITGFVVQCFFARRFVKLAGNFLYGIPILCAMILGIVASCFSTYHIVKAHTKEKVTWLLIHLVSVFLADLMITIGTVLSLYRRNTGLNSTSSLIKRLLRMVFEAAMPPAFCATIDLILTQTLKTKLLWHLLLNYALAKLYVISLLYTMNSIIDYRRQGLSEGRVTYSTSGNLRVTHRGDVELASPSYHTAHLSQVQVHTQTITKLDEEDNLKFMRSGWEGDRKIAQ